MKQGAEADVVDLSQATCVLAVEVAHVVIDKEIVAIDMVDPNVLLAFLIPAVADAVDDEAADKEILKRARHVDVQIVHVGIVA